jgi:hypothetical protein
MSRRQEGKTLYWTLYGVSVAFAVQVIYDRLGILFGNDVKTVVGSLLAVVFLIAVLLWKRKLERIQ